MSDVTAINDYLSQQKETQAIVNKQESGDCFSPPEKEGLPPEWLYLSNHLHERLEAVRADKTSKSTILCVPIPDNGTIPSLLNRVFNIDAVNQMVGKALGTGEQPTPDVDINIDDDHAFFEAEIEEQDEIGEDNRQEIRATGVLKFFDLIPDWLADKLDASIVPFEDRWLATLDINIQSTGHIMVSPIPLGMQLDPTNKRIIVTTFMKGTVNSNQDVPYPMDVEFDYDPMLGFLDDDIDIPGDGPKNIMMINEIYDSGATVNEQIKTLQEAGVKQENFMDSIVAEVIPANQGGNAEETQEFEAVEDDEFLEVELTLTGHRKEEIELVLEQQVVVYVDPEHVEIAKAQMADKLVFLTANMSLSVGLYNPGAPPGMENAEKNDFLQFYLNIKESNGGTLNDAIILHGGPLLALAKLKLPKKKP